MVGGGCCERIPTTTPRPRKRERERKNCDSLVMDGTGNVMMIPRRSAVIREGRGGRRGGRGRQASVSARPRQPGARGGENQGFRRWRRGGWRGGIWVKEGRKAAEVNRGRADVAPGSGQINGESADICTPSRLGEGGGGGRKRHEGGGGGLGAGGGGVLLQEEHVHAAVAATFKIKRGGISFKRLQYSLNVHAGSHTHTRAPSEPSSVFLSPLPPNTTPPPLPPHPLDLKIAAPLSYKRQQLF